MGEKGDDSLVLHWSHDHIPRMYSRLFWDIFLGVSKRKRMREATMYSMMNIYTITHQRIRYLNVVSLATDYICLIHTNIILILFTSFTYLMMNLGSLSEKWQYMTSMIWPLCLTSKFRPKFCSNLLLIVITELY